ncbi:hypothetical protein [Cerasicoccus arenae]|nr:hypothetical protein [Cerasicoccus arenae]
MTLWGIPARIIWGDTLRMTFNGQWENIHWHRVGEPLREQVNAFMDIFKATDDRQEAKLSKTDKERDIDFRTNSTGQQEWIFK